jgi:hypothetical protein
MTQVVDEGHDARASSGTIGLHVVKALLERSSLGTPGARSLRARTDPEAVRRVLQRVRERRAGAPADTPGRVSGLLEDQTPWLVLGRQADGGNGRQASRE